jgi:snapalysin
MVRRDHRWFAGNLLALVVTATALLMGVSPAAAAPTPAAARIIYYDATGAAEFVAAVDQGAANWNSRVTAIQLQPAPVGVRANIIVYADDGWPRAIPTSLGNGRFYMGRTAVRDGHNPTRIAAHEIGHLLGLPDRRTGLCADLMSGSSAGITCSNAFPNASETREVNALFTGSVAIAPLATVW